LIDVSKENIQMGLIDSLVGKCFRDEIAGRVVVFPGDRRKRGYLVSSKAEELKLSSFLKMFFIAHLSIFILGYLLAYGWARWLVFELGSPAAAHIFRTACIFLGIYSLVVGVPYLLFWRTYKGALLYFVSAQDEVLVATKRPGPRRTAALGLLMFGALLLILAGLALIYLTRSK
jgi:hypothetical protein